MMTNMMNTLAEKFRRETGYEPTLKRLEKASAFLSRHGLRSDQVRFENHQDRQWNERRGREPNERQAECIGWTNAQRSEVFQVRWWIVPKRAIQ